MGSENIESQKSADQIRRACVFWLGIENLNITPAPEPNERARSWNAFSEGELPWTDPVRRKRLVLTQEDARKRKRFHVTAYCGVLSGRALTIELREALEATRLQPEDLRRVTFETAPLMIPVDTEGFVSGDIFVSSLPFAMARIREASARRQTGQDSTADFTGIHGLEGLLEKTRKAITELLVKRCLVAAPEPHVSQRPAAAGADKAEALEVAEEASAGTIGATVRVGGPGMAVGGESRSQPSVQDETLRPITLDDIHALLAVVWHKSGWIPVELQSPNGNGDPLVRIHAKIETQKDGKEDKPDDVDALNTFCAEDISRVQAAFASGDVGPALAGYMRGALRADRIDLRGPVAGRAATLEGVCPTVAPVGCWPEKDLVTAQQFAVNKIAQMSGSTGGIYSVSGPPGTGKTTLLRDVVAALMVQRASRMAEFSSPAAALGESFRMNGQIYPARRVHTSLRGFGMVVASANNGAVENVTKELPALSKDMAAAGIDYFSIVSDTVAMEQKEKVRKARTWGMIAAVLGSRARCSKFMGKFWWIDETKEAKEAAKTSGFSADAPRSLQGVMADRLHNAKPWAVARQEFKDAVTASTTLAALVERASAKVLEVREYVRRQSIITDELAAITAQLPAARSEQAKAASALSAANQQARRSAEQLRVLEKLREAQDSCTQARYTLAQASVDFNVHRVAECDQILLDAVAAAKAADTKVTRLQESKPGLIERAFDWGLQSRWRGQLDVALSAVDQADKTRVDAVADLDTAKVERRRIAQLGSLINHADGQFQAAEQAAAALGIHTGVKLEAQRTLAHADADALGRTDGESAKTSKHLSRLIELAEQARTAIAAAQSASLAIFAWLDKEGFDRAFLAKDHPALLDGDQLQLISPYAYAPWAKARKKVFATAIELHKAFIVDGWTQLRPGLIAFQKMLKGDISPSDIPGGPAELWEAFFLVVPVVSTTFASLPRLFAGMGRDSLGWLLVDEAGQGAPQLALGGIWRAKNVVVVGDRRQLEPVVPAPSQMLTPWREFCGADAVWTPIPCSVQALADMANKYGTMLPPMGTVKPSMQEHGEDPDPNSSWIGSPLRVHRRCLNPMFEVANQIAYDGLMVHSVKDSTKQDDWLGPSRWIDICEPAGEGDGHWVPAQGQVMMEMLKDALACAGGGTRNPDGAFHVNIISPFTSVAVEIKKLVGSAYGWKESEMAGTVHTFQGKEAPVVILVLGVDAKGAGAINWAGNENSPNLLNVALTRAKQRIYVVGDRGLWSSRSGIFRILSDALPM